MFNVAMMKSEILNQLCCLKEIIVLRSTMLFQAHPKVHNTYAPCYHCPHMDVDYKGRNEEAEMIYYGNCCIYTPYAFYRLVSDQQMPRTAFLQGRKDDKTISRTSTNTINIEHSYKVKAIFNFKSYCFPLASLLLGLYDYRLKHLAILEEINTTTTSKFYFSYNDDYGVSTTFNVADLAPYIGLEESESRTTPFRGGDDDEAISTKQDVNQAHDVEDVN